MIAYNSNEGSLHTGIVWFFWYAADSAHALGQLIAIDYSDSTPDVAFTYDRLGRQLTVTDILGTRTYVYDALNLLEERHPDGIAPPEGGCRRQATGGSPRDYGFSPNKNRTPRIGSIYHVFNHA